jgi:hypothetical protein
MLLAAHVSSVVERSVALALLCASSSALHESRVFVHTDGQMETVELAYGVYKPRHRYLLIDALQSYDIYTGNSER